MDTTEGMFVDCGKILNCSCCSLSYETIATLHMTDVKCSFPNVNEVDMRELNEVA